MALPDPASFAAGAGGAITVTPELVPHPAFATLLRALSLPALVLEGGAVAMDADGSGNYAVAGAATLLGTRVADASLYLYADAAEAEGYGLQMTGTLDTLKLRTLVDRGIIPPHPRSALDAVLDASFGGAALIFDSDGETLYAGVRGSDQEFPLLVGLGIALGGLGFEFARYYARGGAAYLLRAEMGVGSTVLPVEIELPVDLSLPGQSWTVRPGNSLRLANAIHDVAAFLDGTPLPPPPGLSSWSAAFPAQLAGLSALFLHDVEIHVEPLSMRLQQVSFTVDSADPVSLGQGFVFESAGAAVTAVMWEAEPVVELALSGHLSLNDYASLAIEVDVPPNGQGPWTVEIGGQVQLASLADLDNLPTGVKVGEFHLPDDFLRLESVDLRQLRMVLDPAAGFQSFSVDVATELRVGVGSVVAIENPAFTLDVQNPFGTAGRSVTGSFDGRVLIGGLGFIVRAEKTEWGWDFTGSLDGLMGIGAALDAVAGHFGVSLPASLRNLTLTRIDFRFSTSKAPNAAATSAFDFACTARLPVDGKELDAAFTLSVTEDGPGSHSVKATGTVQLGSGTGARTFTLAFSDDRDSTLLVAAYGKAGGETIRVREDLVEHVSTTLGDFIPGGLEIDFKSALFALDRVTDAATSATAGSSPSSTSVPAASGGSSATGDGSGTTGTARTVYLFGIDIAAGLDLTAIPLIGTELPDDAQVKVDSLQIAVASGPLSAQEVGEINALLPAGDAIRPLPSTPLAQGVNLGAAMDFAGQPQTVAVPVAAAGTTPAPAPPPANPPANVAPSDGAQWITLQKAFGPVHFDRVGVKYEDGAAWFLLDAALGAAGLTLSMQGLSFGSPLDRFEPLFDLKGLGIDYAGGPVEIGGAFARQQVTVDGKETDEYDGAVVLRTEALTLSAIGSYADLEGHPSLFVYAVLDYPLGGPAFFFVTGLTAGFGYNRALAMPALDQVSRFPLVSAAVSGAPPPRSTAEVTKMLSSLSTYLTPKLDEVFLAAGVRFTSFKLVDSFLLAVAAFGDEFELDVLGLSTLVLPTPVEGETPTPLATVQMALRATFQPSQGFLGVSAQLTTASFIIDRACHLTGGFAFYTWLSGEHAGDFALTLGGYHPSFKAPSHYPTVPRLGLNWRVSSELSVQGSLYCALVPSMMMAGGEIKATFKDGSLKAWFTMGMDMMIAWKPYRYDFTAHIDVGVKYTYHFFGKHHISVDVNADLHCWGPDFSGKVHIDLDVVSFTVKFGDHKKKSAAPISWGTFTQSFLPAAAAVCTMAVAGGLLAGGSGGGDLGVVDPRRLRLVTDAVVPSTRASLPVPKAADAKEDPAPAIVAGTARDGAGQPLAWVWDAKAGAYAQATDAKASAFPAPGIGPVGQVSGTVVSTHAVRVEREAGGNWADVTPEFAFTPVLKDVPYALWGNEVTPGKNSALLVKDVLSGFSLTPAAPPTPGATTVVDRANLSYDREDIDGAYAWGAPDAAFTPSGASDESRRATIESTLVEDKVASARLDLCTLLGIDTATVTLDATAAHAAVDAFLVAPELYPSGK